MTIKEMRRAAKMTQKAFAEYIGVSKRTLEGWEHNHPCPDYIRKMIEYRLRTEEKIMETITIYENTNYSGALSETKEMFFTLHETDAGTSEPHDYILPAGYVLGEDVTGAKQIYTDSGEHCELITFGHTPAIIDGASQILLKKSK